MNTAAVSSEHQARLDAGAACLDAALQYHGYGWNVTCCCDPDHVSVGKKHVCDSPGKRPIHPWKQLQTEIQTEADVRQLWRTYPLGNVGVVTGDRSRVLRVDRDGEAGETRWQAINQGRAPDTWTFRSGSGTGLGSLYALPEGFRSQSKIFGAPGEHQELRFQAQGEQTILPPSRHPSGNLYTWVAGHSPEDMALALAPEWLLAYIRYVPRERAPLPPLDLATDAGVVQAALAALDNTTDGGVHYNTWLKVGMALARSDLADAFLLWDAWSRGSSKYSEVETDSTWTAILATEPAHPVRLGSLFYMAQEAGWQIPRAVSHAWLNAQIQLAHPEQEAKRRQNGHARPVPDMTGEPQADDTPAPGNEQQPQDAPVLSWQESLSRTKGGEIRETFRNFVLVLEHLDPWKTTSWYDVVRELPMVGHTVLSEQEVGTAALSIEQRYGIAVHNLQLVQRALVYVCRQHPRDLLQEWLTSLPAWDQTPRLTDWLHDHAGAEKSPYGMGISRLLPVSMVARALNPGCQYRNVVIFEGGEDIGKSKLVKALASLEWYREVSHGLEGKEAHMIIQGAWVAELAELSSLSKTEENRLKSFITMEHDDYIPKFSNLPVSRKRRTVFIGTVNPEGDGTYLRGQTGNTRYLPIAVSTINVDDVLQIRLQLFAEALHYYREHPDDWWQLTAEATTEASDERDKRRQRSIYQDSLAEWLDGKSETTWEEIARSYLLLEAKEKWKDRGLQMEIAKALRGLQWKSGVTTVDGKSVRKWKPPKNYNLNKGCSGVVV